MEENDVLIFNENDFVKTCYGLTKKGTCCKNKRYTEKVNGVIKNYNYCKLHYKQYNFEKPEECPICMEKLDNTPPLKCGHWIHKECIMKWKEDTCPICRAKINFTKFEKKRKLKFHNEKNCNIQDNDITIPSQILELIESMMVGIPENRRNEYILEFLHIDLDNESIVIDNGIDSDILEFTNSDIEDLPDISEY